MWSPLLKLLEALSAPRLPWGVWRSKLAIGDPKGGDYTGSMAWKAQLDPQLLSRTWGPREDGPWRSFHCVTLFASLDALRKDDIGPLQQDPLPVEVLPMPRWLDTTTLLLVDLPGPQSVAVGAALARHGCDLVCTFNNWPHPQGLIPSGETLAALLRYAAWLREERRHTPNPAPVAWLCDRQRLGTQPGKPGQYDNRYYIEDALLPGPTYLRQRGVSRIVYLGRAPVEPLADLEAHLFDYRKQGFEVLASRLEDDGRSLSEPFAVDLSDLKFKTAGFLLAAGGGFGATVPHPSSGG